MNTTRQLSTAAFCALALIPAWAQGPGAGLGRGGGPGNHFAPQGPTIVSEAQSRDDGSMRQPAAPASLSGRLGRPALDGQAERTVQIEPDTYSVNVTRMETVRFVINQDGASKTFTWRFDTLPLRPINLSEVAPPGVLGPQQVMVYVARNRSLDAGGR